MEKVQQKVQDAVNDMISKLDKEHFRKMQSKMYLCSAKCCETDHYSMDDVQNCIDRCNSPVTQAQSFMQNELSSFQSRLQRCAMDCQDTIRDKVGPNTSEAEVSKYRGQLETCVLQCADKHIGLVPAMMKRVKEVLAQHDK